MEATDKVKSEPDKFANLRALVGQRVALQERNGPLVRGLLEELGGDGYLKITGATITGKQKKVAPPFVLVHFSAIGHIHPEVEPESA